MDQWDERHERAEAATANNPAARQAVWLADDPSGADEFAALAAGNGRTWQHVFQVLHKADRPGSGRIPPGATNESVALTLNDSFGRGYDAVRLTDHTTTRGARQPGMTRQISVDEAKGFFAHPSQGLIGELPADGVAYWADGPVCGAFRDFCWPRMLDVHCAVKPEAWGNTVPHARAILEAVWSFYAPDLIVAQSLESNRAVLAMNRRLGFEVIGTMPTPRRVVIQGWRR